MAKHTHKGTCQVCGNVQAVGSKQGRPLSLHGYTVDWGYFSGTCSGSKRQPLELDRSVLDASVRHFRSDAKTKAAMTVDDIITVAYLHRPNTYAQAETKCFGNAEDWDLFRNAPGRGMYGDHWNFMSMKKRQLAEIHRHAKLLAEHADALVVLAEERHGKPLYPVDRRRVCSKAKCDNTAIGEAGKARWGRGRTTERTVRYCKDHESETTFDSNWVALYKESN